MTDKIYETLYMDVQVRSAPYKKTVYMHGRIYYDNVGGLAIDLLKLRASNMNESVSPTELKQIVHECFEMATLAVATALERKLATMGPELEEIKDTDSNQAGFR